MLYVLAYPTFTPSQARSIDRFRARHEPERARLVGPHVTLVFVLPSLDACALCEATIRAVSGTAAIPVAFDRFVLEHDPFENAHKIFLLASTGGDALTALHRRLYHEAGQVPPGAAHVYRPHMTVATHPARDALESLDASEIGGLPIRARVEAVDVVRVADGQLETLMSVPLAT